MIQQGDFLGFTLDGVHSSSLNIMRTSDGSRYNNNLLPNFSDKTIDVPGSDGAYFFGTNYKQRQISFAIAYDSMTEQNLRDLRSLLAQRKIMDLIFDEEPYKVYKVRTNGSPSLKYICFDKDEDTVVNNKEELYLPYARTTNRIYKGEGTLSFSCFSPFAQSRFKYIDQYNVQNTPELGDMDTNLASDVFNNIYEWQSTAKLIKQDTYYNDDFRYPLDKFMKKEDNTFYNKCAIYNPGDMDVPFQIRLDFGEQAFSSIYLSYKDKYLRIQNIVKSSEDTGIIIDSKLSLIKGIKAEPVKMYRKIGQAPDEIYEETKINIYYPKEDYYKRIKKDDDTYEYKLLTEYDYKKLQKEEKIKETGNLYNQFITQGDFFKLPIIKKLDLLNLQISNNAPSVILINYNYLYY